MPEAPPGIPILRSGSDRGEAAVCSKDVPDICAIPEARLKAAMGRRPSCHISQPEEL